MFDDEYRYLAHSEHAKQLSLMSCYCRVYGLGQCSSNWGSRRGSMGVARDFKFWIFRDYDDFGRKVAKYKVNWKRRPFFFREHLDFGGK